MFTAREQFNYTVKLLTEINLFLHNDLRDTEKSKWLLDDLSNDNELLRNVKIYLSKLSHILGKLKGPDTIAIDKKLRKASEEDASYVEYYNAVLDDVEKKLLFLEKSISACKEIRVMVNFWKTYHMSIWILKVISIRSRGINFPELDKYHLMVIEDDLNKKESRLRKKKTEYEFYHSDLRRNLKRIQWMRYRNFVKKISK